MNRTGYHSFWSKPRLLTSPEEGVIIFHDFEVLTMALGAILYRRHSGPIHLVTDERGLKFFESAGLVGLYDQVKLLEISEFIDPKIFWAGGKILAHALFDPPQVSFDLDCVLWKPLPEDLGNVMALHPDDVSLPCYHCNREFFGSYGFLSSAWNWSVAPANTAILAFASNVAKRAYCAWAEMFMELYSARPHANEHLQNASMVFAEQRILALAASRLGVGINFLASTNSRHGLKYNPSAAHLCGTKHLYNLSIHARIGAVNYLITVLSQYPEAAPFLKKNGLVDLKTGEDYGFIGFERIAELDPRVRSAMQYRRIVNLKGAGQIRDVNFPINRPVREDDPVFLAFEDLDLEPDSKCDLMEE